MFKSSKLFLQPLKYLLGHNAGTGLFTKLFQTSSTCSRVFEVPSEEEVLSFKKRYHEPKQLVHDLLMPMVFSGQISEPNTTFTPKLNGQYWKVRLQVAWPHVMTFTGTHHTIDRAEENAYFMACQLFESVGLIFSDEKGAHPVSQDHVFHVLEKLFTRHAIGGTGPTVFKMTSSCVQTKDRTVEWMSEIHVPAHSDFTVSARSRRLETSQYMVCLKACMKLKVLNLLTNKNSLVEERYLKYFSKLNLKHKLPTVEEFDPDYQIYVDASKVGFGAYLLTKTEEKIRWMSESWPQHFGEESTGVISRRFDSSFFEFYALIAACYTWKYKFSNKRLLCWSDNQHAVKLVNDTQDFVTYRDTQFGKLGMILLNMCKTYNIEIQALHVQRDNNIAADLLSRVQIAKFKEILPTADEKSKKVKKLLFANPLVPKEFDPRNKGVS